MIAHHGDNFTRPDYIFFALCFIHVFKRVKKLEVSKTEWSSFLNMCSIKPQNQIPHLCHFYDSNKLKIWWSNILISLSYIGSQSQMINWEITTIWGWEDIDFRLFVISVLFLVFIYISKYCSGTCRLHAIILPKLKYLICWKVLPVVTMRISKQVNMRKLLFTWCI